MSKNQPLPQPANLSKRRLYTGIGIWVTGQLSPLCIPLIPLLGLSEAFNTTLATVIFFGFSSLFTLAAIAVLGRDGFNYLKSRLFAMFKRCAPLVSVSRMRYHIGLVLFSIPLLLAWVAPYLTPLLPVVEDHEIKIALAGDAILLISLLVLGGEFWEKLRGLFIYRPAAVPEAADS